MLKLCFSLLHTTACCKTCNCSLVYQLVFLENIFMFQPVHSFYCILSISCLGFLALFSLLSIYISKRLYIENIVSRISCLFCNQALFNVLLSRLDFQSFRCIPDPQSGISPQQEMVPGSSTI